MSWTLDPDGSPIPIYTEDNEFLNNVDKGYIGLGQPVIKFIPDPYQGIPAWVIRYFEFQAKSEGMSLEQYIEKYDPILDPVDWDDGPASPSEAWA